MSKLDLLLEAERRGILPADKAPLLEEARKRGLVPSGDSPDAGLSPEQKRDYKINQALGNTGFARRVLQSATFGGSDEFASLGNAAVDTIGDMVNRRPIDFVKRFQDRQKTEEALNADMRRKTDGVGGFVADVAGGFGSLGPARAGLTAASGQVPGVLQTGWDLAKAGAGYGAVNSFLSTDGSLGQRAAATPEGAAVGAVGGLAIGGTIGGLIGARNYFAGRSADKAAQVAERAAVLEDAGVPVFAPAVTGSPTARLTAQGLANSPVGGDLRRGARESIEALQRNVSDEINRPLGGLTGGELGNDIQGTLKRSIVDRSIPSERIEAMPNADLERITGPVTGDGFRPPRPVVDPVQPNHIPDLPPQVGDVPPIKPVDPKYPDLNVDQFPPPPELATQRSRLAGAHQNAVDRFNANVERFSHQEGRILERLNKSGVQAVREVQGQPGTYVVELTDMGARGRVGTDYFLVSQSEAIRGQNNQQSVAINDALRWLRDDAARRAERKAGLKHIQGMQAELDKLDEAIHHNRWDAYSRANAEGRSAAERAAQEETARLQEQARVAAETQARDRAAMETERLRGEEAARVARMNADRQKAADDQWAQMPPKFEVGRTKESYPSEFDAAYTRVEREYPRIQRNVLGEKKNPYGPGPDKTQTATLLNEVALEGRAQMKENLRAYAPERLFNYEGGLHPGLLSHLKERLPPEIADRLAAYSDFRAGGKFVSGMGGLHDFRTQIGRAIRDARRAERFPDSGQTRTYDTALLERLYKAVDEDLVAAMNAQGAQGQRAIGLREEVDAAYKAHQQAIREPLAKVFGEKVSGPQALERLAKAAETHDTKTLGAFMRVMREKDDPVRGAAAIMQHMSGSGANIDDFLKAFAKLRPQTRDVMFSGKGGPEYRATLEKLEKAAKMLQPFSKAAKGGDGIDLSRLTHLGPMAGLVFHFWPTMSLMAGGAAASRFLASPRYMKWLTTVPKAMKYGPDTHQAALVLSRLTGIAANDPEYGREILKAAKSVLLPSSARADHPRQ